MTRTPGNNTSLRKKHPYAGLKILHAAVCIIFGFYLASSSLAPDIANITASLFRLL